MLPAAAVYLAEAEWRVGHEGAADAAMDVAVAAATRQGSNHAQLRALADFPAVLSRRIDAEPGPDSDWHALARALIAQDYLPGAPVAAHAVHVVEFGPKPLLTAFGREFRPTIAKSLELLAYLLAHGGTAGRTRILEDLFGGRRDDSAQAYLRQAIRRLREVLPEPEVITLEEGAVRLSDAAPLTADSARFEARTAEAARLRGADRLRALTAALELYDRGPYLNTYDSPWIDERRDRLAELATTVRLEAAAANLELGRFEQAQELVETALETDPYREGGWRLAMSIADARGRPGRRARAIPPL